MLLFSAYVDSRQGFGPAELRDALARQLLERQGAERRSAVLGASSSPPPKAIH